jgi:hypothetical protein
MNKYQETPLWENSFGDQANLRFADSRKFFRDEYETLRNKVKPLVAQIPKDIPGLTVHDVTHLDALWESASTVAGSSYPLNPAEAYVFGAAVLLHDAGLAMASYPGGLNEIYGTAEWRDSVAEYLSNRPSDQQEDFSLMQRSILARVLRDLHAKHAEKLPFVFWTNDAGTQDFLIDNGDLREFYGSTIGRIAASHHLPTTKLPGYLQRSVGAISSAPSEWTMDTLKIACLLRAADAANIDERRAPRFLSLLLRPEGVSKLHWNFQTKLAKPRLDSDVLVYTSGPEFGLADADAWWLCFDTITMIDRELRDCDVLLHDFKLPRFAAKRVRGAESPKALSELVKTRDWEPVDTAIKVANVPHLAEMLGGANLYGKKLAVPIREMIQNSTDAISARRLLENKSSSYGTVKVQLGEVPTGWALIVEDEGIGMSERTLAGALLDFGKSFWASDEVKSEFPGLLAKGMKPVGRFGIGFFSVFMLGDKVTVTSQRFDAAKDSTSTLEFRSGLELRPILRRSAPHEYLPSGGTRVSIELKCPPFDKGGLFHGFEQGDLQHAGNILRSMVGSICPGTQVNVQAGPDSAGPLYLADDWTSIPGRELLKRVGRVSLSSFTDSDGWHEAKTCETYGKFVRTLIGKDGTLYGRACVTGTRATFSTKGIVTVGGLSATSISQIGGILVGSTTAASRDAALPLVPADVLASWATEQAELIAQADLNGPSKLHAAGAVMLCGGDPRNLPLLEAAYGYPTRAQLKRELESATQLAVFEGESITYDEDKDACHPREFANEFELNASLYLLSERPGRILNVDSKEWPNYLFEGKELRSYGSELRALLSETWGDFEEWSTRDYRVGTAGGSDIFRHVTIYTRVGEEPDSDL